MHTYIHDEGAVYRQNVKLDSALDLDISPRWKFCGMVPTGNFGALNLDTRTPTP